VAEVHDDAVHVHSVQEAYFSMMVHRCACGGPWLGHLEKAEGPAPALRYRAESSCHQCHRKRTFEFVLDTPQGPAGAIRQINPTADPSQALDVAEWMDLAQFYLGRVERLTKAVERTQSMLDARQCVEEAMKFYPAGAEDPPPESLWSDASRKKVAAKPQAYRRSSLTAMLDKFPTMDRLRQADAMEQKTFTQGVKELAKKRVRWWQFWRMGQSR
jgi:hypothetical protein